MPADFVEPGWQADRYPGRHVADAVPFGRAERALHARAALFCDAAVDAGLPGRFHAWRADDLMAVLASDPALSFLSTITGVSRETAGAALDLADSSAWGGVAPAVVVSLPIDDAVLSAAGLTRAEDRVLAIRALDDERAPDPAVRAPLTDDEFLPVLLAGYEVDGVIAAFLSAEHRAAAVRRLLLFEHDVPVAAAAMSIHDDVAVLGGASTLPAHRGRGAQSRLLRDRLRIAAEAGCNLAVATARPGSVSEGNLRRAGFQIHPRAAWVRPG